MNNLIIVSLGLCIWLVALIYGANVAKGKNISWSWLLFGILGPLAAALVLVALLVAKPRGRKSVPSKGLKVVLVFLALAYIVFTVALGISIKKYLQPRLLQFRMQFIKQEAEKNIVHNKIVEEELGSPIIVFDTVEWRIEDKNKRSAYVPLRGPKGEAIMCIDIQSSEDEVINGSISVDFKQGKKKIQIGSTRIH